MNTQNDRLKMALTQMVELGREFLIEIVSKYSRLNNCTTTDEKCELEKLYYNEINATANVIRLFTDRIFSYQWTSGENGEFKTGFAIYEIKNDAPCDKSLSYFHNRYSGESEPTTRYDWGEGCKQGKIVKIYELKYDINANPVYIGGFLASEFLNS